MIIDLFYVENIAIFFYKFDQIYKKLTEKKVKSIYYMKQREHFYLLSMPYFHVNISMSFFLFVCDNHNSPIQYPYKDDKACRNLGTLCDTTSMLFFSLKLYYYSISILASLSIFFHLFLQKYST